MTGETAANRMRAMRNRRPDAAGVVNQPYEDPTLQNRRRSGQESHEVINEKNARRIQADLFELIPGLEQALNEQDREQRGQ